MATLSEKKIPRRPSLVGKAFMIVGGVVFAAGSLYVSIWTYTGEKQALRIQKAFVRSALNQDAAWFDTHNREELPTTMGTNIVYMNTAIGRSIADTFGRGVSALGCLVVAFLLNTPLAFIMLAAIPVVVIIMLIFNYFIRRASKDANKELGMAGSVATEVIAGIKTVAALCAKEHFGSKYTHHLDQAERFAIRSGVLQSALAGIVAILFYFTYCYAFYVGTEQVLSNSGTINFIKCFFADEDDPACKVSGASVMCCIYGVILCVTFIGLMVPGLTNINLGRQADFNLSVQSGQSVALVGPSGSGKSKIARFLLRFYDPNSGAVLIDGTRNVAWWRSKVGYVEQESRLFPATIRDNIALGMSKDPKACSESEIIEACKAACAHDFIMELPDGYDTHFGGTGVQLSGGQMQRIAIARAIIRKPVVLVLDEATSALESTSERHVTEAIANVRKTRQMTTVTIAHRLSTIIDSGVIAVLDKGKIQELGNHKTLYEKDGIYTLLCQTQGIGADFSVAAAEISHKSEQTYDKTVDAEVGMEQAQGHAKDGRKSSLEMMEVFLAPMSKIWGILGARDTLFAAMGIKLPFWEMVVYWRFVRLTSWYAKRGISANCGRCKEPKMSSRLIKMYHNAL
ncbi:ABC transporter permease [Nitzschia inconspicua]|uniref:ABC transporter permease n=1 Tax=Nitzschia inconspicua TaxID=303405 RepID=A0A9K3P9H3_9STRA|nr:ABC transporter permease [Nitzschia inconspicua]KAG7374906.1 ABC transporter permease [Nitzschia inconspicua]